MMSSVQDAFNICLTHFSCAIDEIAEAQQAADATNSAIAATRAVADQANAALTAALQVARNVMGSTPSSGVLANTVFLADD